MSAQRKQRNTHPPTLTVFAGPNGSGKTTLTNRLLTENRLGILVNADQIAERLAQVGGKLTATTEMQIQAAKAAEEMRWELLNQGASFTTETVMSDHSRWIRFFEAAHERGYLMSLIFVTTSDPAINIGRVSQRVRMGGRCPSSFQGNGNVKSNPTSSEKQTGSPTDGAGNLFAGRAVMGRCAR